jgi:hypothetical protein
MRTHLLKNSSIIFLCNLTRTKSQDKLPAEEGREVKCWEGRAQQDHK